MIQKNLSSVQILWKMFMRTLIITTQKKEKLIADIMNNKKFQAVVKELFIRCRKFYISFVFITQSQNFSVPKECQTKLNSLFDYEN